MAAVSPLKAKGPSKHVFVVGGDYEIENMFRRRGWGIATKLQRADLIQFTGGEDVDPRFYRSQKHAATSSNVARDLKEKVVFDWAQKLGSSEPIPTAGICRGGQFLNVMCGGEMWQHVNGHAGSHIATDEVTDTKVMATSTHHQMMMPTKDAFILMTASMSNRKESVNGQGLTTMLSGKNALASKDVEAVCYVGERALCFQPHPEYKWAKPELTDLYFRYIDDMLFS